MHGDVCLSFVSFGAELAHKLPACGTEKIQFVGKLNLAINRNLYLDEG